MRIIVQKQSALMGRSPKRAQADKMLTDGTDFYCNKQENLLQYSQGYPGEMLHFGLLAGIVRGGPKVTKSNKQLVKRKELLPWD